MRDLTKTMEITMKDLDIDDDEEQPGVAGKEGAGVHAPAPPAASASSVPDETDSKIPKPATPAPEKLSHEKFSPEKLSPEKLSTPPRSGASTPSGSKLRVPSRPMLTEKSDEETRMAAEGMTQEERELRKKEKKKGLSKEQKDELAQYDLERRKVREERINTLAQKLVDRICVWTETDKGADVTHAFNEKTKVWSIDPGSMLCMVNRAILIFNCS